jgi:N-hydroxyarylamine O-acetyltransferase
MKADNFSLARYFDRIGFHAEPKADIATVTGIMRAHLFSIPFENLDIQAGHIISLVPEDIVEKIITKNRGGYCFEVNTLFAMALEALGIPYQFIAARPMIYPEKKPRIHMAIMVSLDGEQWLCDLGFGSYGIRSPLRMDVLDTEVKQEFDTFILSKVTARDYVLKALSCGEWITQYGFDLSPHELIDFVPANYFNSTHPDSIFVQKLLIVLHNRTGRKILVGNILKIVTDGIMEKRIIEPEQRSAVLFDHFGLRLAA